MEAPKVNSGVKCDLKCDANYGMAWDGFSSRTKLTFDCPDVVREWSLVPVGNPTDSGAPSTGTGHEIVWTTLKDADPLQDKPKCKPIVCAVATSAQCAEVGPTYPDPFVVDAGMTSHCYTYECPEDTSLNIKPKTGFFKSGETCEVRCLPHYGLRGSSYFLDTPSDTSTVLVTASCPTEGDVEGVWPSTSPSVGHGGYKLTGAGTGSVTDVGIWSPLESPGFGRNKVNPAFRMAWQELPLPVCQRIVCSSPDLVPPGEIYDTDDCGSADLFDLWGTSVALMKATAAMDGTDLKSGTFYSTQHCSIKCIDTYGMKRFGSGAGNWALRTQAQTRTAVCPTGGDINAAAHQPGWAAASDPPGCEEIECQTPMIDYAVFDADKCPIASIDGKVKSGETCAIKCIDNYGLWTADGTEVGGLPAQISYMQKLGSFSMFVFNVALPR